MFLGRGGGGGLNVLRVEETGQVKNHMESAA